MRDGTESLLWNANGWTAYGRRIAAVTPRRANAASGRYVHKWNICWASSQRVLHRSPPACKQCRAIKLTRLGEKDEIEAYLTTFERIMEVNEVAKERWPFQLAPQLTGKAQQAYAALTPEDAKDYDAVKNAIFRR